MRPTRGNFIVIVVVIVYPSNLIRENKDVNRDEEERRGMAYSIVSKALKTGMITLRDTE